ncbi:MAG: glutathione S-transferase family protein, partial [Gammaproteobacteria bacterium]|nr:glutathione S-transferase family protein [Gammaproteobacteria bacterium]NIR85514.1 glutathione S-transferase family protein [Gammaproteobacteria bacterium]NIR89773.1 glutathione S-transferase family protein [Gammaproteobacteria bacterium]NIU06649.1 glutathione S-transferase family protein [Gammaproteobacteria bacterium]NIV75040.1 glutathione S-transferase family protein [Gammaproteobacteria bacterium]
YEPRYVDLDKAEQRSPEYLAVNPGGYVPALVAEDGQILYESAAIVLYLCDRHPQAALAPAPAEPARGLFYRSLFFLTNTVQEAYKRLYYPQRYSTDEGDAPKIRAQAERHLRERWAIVDRTLQAAGPYHLRDRYSAADLYMLMLATWYEPPQALLEEFRNVRRCYERVAERPAVRRVMDAHEGD